MYKRQGLGIHLRDVLPQLHTFRPRLKRKAVWSDLHKLTAVAGLPFQFMIAYTGALIVLGTYSIALVGFPLYSDNFERAQEVAFGAPPPSIDAPEVPAEQAPASRWIATAEAALPTMRVERLTTKGPRLRTTVIEISGRPSAAPGSVNVWVSGSDAEVLGVRAPENSTPAVEAQRWLLGLHFAEFGGWALDLVYALLAVITGATIISGNALWLARRQRQADRRSDRVLARLTVGFAAGVPLAIGATLLASRVLPMSWQGRGPWIDLAFLAALAAACLVAGWLRTTSSAYAWLLYAAAASFAALPLAQRFALGWKGSGPWGGPGGVLMGVELGFVVTALMLTAAARAIARRGESS
ncbi:MAG: PepSY domain-containing protein [Nannocystaceae bacterium]|nr:PepSY domain-containing protein [Nannocystaceae bacterium]